MTIVVGAMQQQGRHYSGRVRRKEITPAGAKKTLASAPGLNLLSNDEEYPMPVNVLDKDDVFVGRIRQDHVFENGLAMWVAADNLRKGAALNAIQIAEEMVKRDWVKPGGEK